MITGAHVTVFAQDADADDIHRTVEDLENKGVEFVEPIADEGFGPITRLRVPGAGELSLYQPTYPSPLGG
jgi:hypothetical protein